MYTFPPKDKYMHELYRHTIHQIIEREIFTTGRYMSYGILSYDPPDSHDLSPQYKDCYLSWGRAIGEYRSFSVFLLELL